MNFHQFKIILLFVAGMVLHSQSVSAQWVPELKFNPDGPVYADFIGQLLDIRLAEIALYDKHTRDPQAARPVVRRFLKAAAQRLVVTTVRKSDPRVADLASLGEEAIRLGSKDPLFRRYYCSLLNVISDRSASRAEIDSVLNTFEKSSYPKHFRVEYLLLKSQIYGKGMKYRANMKGAPYKSLKQQLTKIHQAVPAYVKWMSGRPDFQRPCLRWIWQCYDVNYEHLNSRIEKQLDPYWQKLVAGFIESYAVADHMDPWLLAMLRGKLHTALAWQARGTGAAFEVDMEDFEVFRRENAIAVGHLKDAYKLNPERPEAAEDMVWQVRSGHGDSRTLWIWLQRSLDAEVDSKRAC